MKKITKILMLCLVMAGFLGISAQFNQPVHADQTDPTYAKIKKSGKLVVGTAAHYAPYEFHTETSGDDEIKGFDIQVARTIAKKLGVKLVIKDMRFDSLLGSLKTGKIDMIIAGMDATPEREKQIDFSEPYFQDPSVIMVNKDDKAKLAKTSQIKDATLGAQLSSIQDQDAHAAGAKKVVSLSSTSDLVSELQENKLTGVVVATTIADTYMAKSNQFTVAKAKLPQASSAGCSIGMPKDSPVLKAKVNEIISKDVLGAPINHWQKQATKESLAGKNKSFFQKYSPLFLKGTLLTIGLALIGALGGLILGIILGLMKLSKHLVLKWPADAYVEAFRGVPLLIQVFMVFFGTQMIGLNISSFAAGALALVLNSGAYTAEIIRGGVQSIDKGQTEAARSLGFSQTKSMQLVILPQAIKNMLPALGNEFVTVLKDGSIVSVIGVGELTFQTTVVQGASFEPFFPLVVAAVIYFILTFGFNRLLGLYEKHKKLAD